MSINAIKTACKSADIEIPDKMAELLRHDLNEYFKNGVPFQWEYSDQDVFDWYNSEDNDISFKDWINNNAFKHIDAAETVKDTVGYEIQYVVKNEAKYREFDGLREKVMNRANEIALNLYDNEKIFLGDPVFERKVGMNCNILVGSKQDANDLFSSTDSIAAFLEGDKDDLNPEDGDTGIIWLLHSQGYELADLKNIYGTTNYLKKNLNFLETLDLEFQNAGGQYGGPAFLVTMEIKDLEHLKQGGNIEIGKNAVCGMPNVFVGGGSTMEVALEKPVVINRDMIFELQIEGAKNYHHSLDSIYGFSGKAWDETVGLVANKEPLPFENFSDAELEKAGALTQKNQMTM